MGPGSVVHWVVAAVLLLLETCALLVKIVLLWLKSMMMAFVPTRLIAKDISGKTVLLTGAGGGIGCLMAERFAALGCNVVLWDVNQALNENTASKLHKYRVGVSAHTVDVCNRDAVYDTAKKVLKEFGQVDILVNNAGIVFGKRVLEATEDQMVKTMQVNCLAHYWTLKAFLPSMIKRNSGHLVTVASSAGHIGVPGMADYCASKFAAVGFEESLRLEIETMGKTGVKTTVVCPYLIDTGMFSGCKSKYPWLIDSLKPEYVADKIIDSVLREQRVLYIPRLIYILVFLKSILPVPCQIMIQEFSGANALMNTFAGSHTKSL